MAMLLLLICALASVCSMTSVTIHGVTDELKGDYEKYSKALKTSEEVFNEVEAIFNDPNYSEKVGWKKDEWNDDGDIVYAKKHARGKMVTVTTILDCEVNLCMNETWNGVPDLPNWNANINFASVVAKPTENFDIITYGNNDVLIISGRDFLSGRIYRKLPGGGYIMASRSVDLPEYPEKEGKVRAELILAGVRFRPVPEDTSKTICDVVMLADLKGLLPKFVVSQVFGKIMLMDTVTNREHFAEVAEKAKAVPQ